MNLIERAIESLFFSSRWLMAPFLFGLMVGLCGLLYKFGLKLVEFFQTVQEAKYNDVIVGILSLIDLSLVANLILIVICSTYENFVRPINAAAHPNWPDGLIRIGFAGLKQKLLGSLVAITAVQVLEWFMDIENHLDPVKLGWVVGILLAFAVTMLILALADYLSARTGGKTH
jgi:uncharacterized protein (TIGR00645 family)